MKLFNGEDIDWPAYELGQSAYNDYLKTNIKSLNPFPEYCNRWLSWNRGWNS